MMSNARCPSAVKQYTIVLWSCALTPSSHVLSLSLSSPTRRAWSFDIENMRSLAFLVSSVNDVDVENGKTNKQLSSSTLFTSGRKETDICPTRCCCRRHSFLLSLSSSSWSVHIYKIALLSDQSVLSVYSLVEMRAVVTLSTVLVLFICHGRIAAELFTCSNDTTDFATRVQGSSTVVYGQARAKELHQGSDTLFYVQFQVDCILKGPATSRTINITEAGRICSSRMPLY